MALLVAVALFIDLRDGGTEKRPFAAADLEAGTTITGAQVEWRDVPRGLLPLVDVDGNVAAHVIEQGDPLVPSALAEHRPPPQGWWSVELPLPDGATAGKPARVVAVDPPLATEAIVVSISDGGAFDSSTTGLVAVPPDFADALARAASRGNAVVLLAP